MQPETTALRFDLDQRVTALAGALSRRGVEFGDRVLILMLNRTEFIESFLAINKLGAIAVPVNFRMTPSEIAFLVSDCQAEAVGGMRRTTCQPEGAAVAGAVLGGGSGFGQLAA